MTVHIERWDHMLSAFRLSTELKIGEHREHVFKFFADAFQLEKITPPWLHFSVETPRPIMMHEGTLIDYRLRMHGLPIRWPSRISLWHPPFQFVDERVRGPYRQWLHLHTFEEVECGTLVRYEVHYNVPLGFILHPLLVRRDLVKIFEYRQQTLRKLFTA